MKKDEPFAKLGVDPVPPQPKNIWCISFEEDYGTNAKTIEGVVPLEYFVTTGDAVIKSGVLLKDARAMVKFATKLHNTLKKCKAENKYLETEWRGGHLIIKIKNPRKTKNPKAKSYQTNKFRCEKCGRIFQKKFALSNHKNHCEGS